MLPVPQLIAPGTLDSRQLLPSFLYLPSEQEFAPGSLGLPWEPGAREIVGELARTHGAKVPARLVSSAKSWLSHPGVDRTAALLPWNAPPEVKKVSALEASARYLRHLKQAWEAGLGEGAPLAEQELILTVPASFDAAARELTLTAAREAGLPTPTLLEVQVGEGTVRGAQIDADRVARHVSSARPRRAPGRGRRSPRRRWGSGPRWPPSPDASAIR